MSVIDLNSIPPDIRKNYILVGQDFGSTDTFTQAEQTLESLIKHGDKLIPFGFIAADKARLEAAKDLLLEAGVGRETVRTGKKKTSKVYLDAMREGKAARLRGRTVLEICNKRIWERMGEAVKDLVATITVTLDRTKSAGTDAQALCEQLEQLKALFSYPEVEEEGKERGGPDAVTKMAGAIGKLLPLSQQRRQTAGTPTETEHLDLIDGIIVELVREARKAARSASKELGEPSLAKAFELNKLYSSSPKKKEETPATPPVPSEAPSA